MMLVRGGNFFDNIEQFESCHRKEPCAFKNFKKICKINTGGYFRHASKKKKKDERAKDEREWSRMCDVCKAASKPYELKKASLREFLKGYCKNNSAVTEGDMNHVTHQNYLLDF